MRKSVHLIGYFHICVSRLPVLFVIRVFAPHFFSSSYSNTLSRKNKFKYEFNSIQSFWYYMHFQVRGCTFNISHTSFWYDIKACVLQHLGKDITLL